MNETSPTPLDYAARPSRARRVRLVLLAAALAMSLPVAVAVRNVARSVRHSGRPLSATVQAVDADTGRPVHIAVGGPSIMGPSDPWSVTYTTSDDLSKMRLAWRDVDDLPITVESPGYVRISVKLNGRTPGVLTVPLRKER